MEAVKSCVARLNVVSSPDAVGLPADLFCVGRVLATTGPCASAKIDGHSTDREAGANFTLCFNHRVSVVGCGLSRLADMGPRPNSGRIGTGGAWARRNPDRGNCRRSNIGRIAVAESSADGTIVGE